MHELLLAVADVLGHLTWCRWCDGMGEVWTMDANPDLTEHGLRCDRCVDGLVWDRTWPTGIEGDLQEPGGAEWLQSVSASKVAVILGISPFQSPFALWHRMAGTLPGEDDNDVLRRGHYLEPAIAAWFADQHPTWSVATTGTWSHPERPWQTASPDRIVTRDDGVVVLLECKSDHEDWQWGEPGTDEIPPHYRAQGLWQLDTLGLDVCHFAVIGGHLVFREYVLRYDPAEAAELRAAAAEFVGTLERHELPDIDGSDSTYQAIRELHPEIDGTDVEIPWELAEEFIVARHLAKEWTSAEKSARSRIAQAMGLAKRARCDDHTIATRQVRDDGRPFVVAGRRLPPVLIPPTTATPRSSAA